MSLSTYAGLVTHIAGKLEKDESSITPYVDDWIALTEARINAADPPIRTRHQITRNAAFSVDAEFEDMPADFLAPRSARLTTGDKRLLQFFTPEQMGDFKYGPMDSGTLLAYAVVGSQFEFGPAPDATYVVALTYYAKLPALTEANTSNWLLANYPQAYVAGVLIEAGVHYQDDALIKQNTSLFIDALGSIRSAEKSSEFGANFTPLPSAIPV